jgi:hypothetical protein
VLHAQAGMTPEIEHPVLRKDAADLCEVFVEACSDHDGGPGSAHRRCATVSRAG